MLKYEVILKPQAIKDMDSLEKYYASIILDEIEKYLRYKPDFIRKSRIKKLRGIQKFDYRLRVGDYRIFYNINGSSHTVDILRIMHKRKTNQFYKEE